MVRNASDIELYRFRNVALISLRGDADNNLKNWFSFIDSDWVRMPDGTHSAIQRIMGARVSTYETVKKAIQDVIVPDTQEITDELKVVNVRLDDLNQRFDRLSALVLHSNGPLSSRR